MTYKLILSNLRMKRAQLKNLAGYVTQRKLRQPGGGGRI